MAARVETQRKPGGRVVKLSGVIDGDLPRAELLGSSTGCVVFDLGGVEQITSYGVREWCEVMLDFPTEHLAFVNVRPQVVVQFNVVDGFAGHGTLVSFWAPFGCPSCDHDFEVLIDLRTDRARLLEGGGEPPCPQCGAASELDDDPTAFFDFALRQGECVLSPELTALLDGGNAPGLSLKKSVNRNVTSVWLNGQVSRRTRIKRALDGIEGPAVAVFAGVTDVQPEGQSTLDPLFSNTDSHAPIWIARIRPSVIASLSESQHQQLRGRVVSLWDRTSCDCCGLTTYIEITAQMMDDRIARRFVWRCRRCSTTVTVAGDRDRLPQLRALMAENVPASIRSYLEEHPGSEPSGTLKLTSLSEAREAKHYTVKKHIGSGGMAQVYLGEHKGPNGFAKAVAIKKLRPELSEHPGFRTLFIQEARLSALINHPSVVQIFDLGRSGPDYFLVMEYVQGWSLDTLMRAAARLGRRMPVELACYVGSHVAAALHAAHTCRDARGQLIEIIHRDVSPHNVLVGLCGDVKLTDFGVARAASERAVTPGTLIGRLSYMAPERLAEGYGPVTTRSDVFSAGVVLYECLAGSNPFRERNTQLSVEAILQQPIPTSREDYGNPDVDDALADVIAKAVAREQTARYETALHLQRELDGHIARMGKPASSAYLAEWIQGLVAEARHGSDKDVDPAEPTDTMGTAFELANDTLRELVHTSESTEMDDIETVRLSLPPDWVLESPRSNSG